jgi:glyoxylase-like metal-dependent hydrolase (beta-lactamase superfamily II)
VPAIVSKERGREKSPLENVPGKFRISLMKFVFEQLRTGGDRNFAYLIGDREAGVAAIVDPSYDPKAVVARAEAQSLRVEFIINTHGHPDHTNGNGEAQKLTMAKILAGQNSRVRPDVEVADGQELLLGSLTLRFFHVPGHCDDHLLIYLPEQRVAITGDHLFVGKIGGTGSDAAARVEYESLARILEALPDDATIWPGHDYGCRPSSTLALEKATNPFLLRMGSLEDFLLLKRDWARFKEENGLK